MFGKCKKKNYATYFSREMLARVKSPCPPFLKRLFVVHLWMKVLSLRFNKTYKIAFPMKQEENPKLMNQ